VSGIPSSRLLSDNQSSASSITVQSADNLGIGPPRHREKTFYPRGWPGKGSWSDLRSQRQRRTRQLAAGSEPSEICISKSHVLIPKQRSDSRSNRTEPDMDTKQRVESLPTHTQILDRSSEAGSWSDSMQAGAVRLYQAVPATRRVTVIGRAETHACSRVIRSGNRGPVSADTAPVLTSRGGLLVTPSITMFEDGNTDNADTVKDCRLNSQNIQQTPIQSLNDSSQSQHSSELNQSQNSVHMSLVNGREVSFMPSVESPEPLLPKPLVASETRLKQLLRVSVLESAVGPYSYRFKCQANQAVIDSNSYANFARR